MTTRTRPIIVLVTGGRKYNNRDHIWSVLDSIATYYPGFCVVQGGAKGADAWAKAWAIKHGHPSFTCDAAWDFYGNNAAGPVSNGFMIEFMTVDMVIHFPGNTGTANMVRQAKAKGITCYEG
jgi:hypothetical protein